MDSDPKAEVFLGIVNLPPAISKEPGHSLGVLDILHAYMNISKIISLFILLTIDHSLELQGFLLVLHLIHISLYPYPNSYLMVHP